MPKKSTTKPILPYGVIGHLADVFGVHPFTIERWLENLDDRLTSDKAKAVFAEWDIDWKNTEVLEPEASAA